MRRLWLLSISYRFIRWALIRITYVVQRLTRSPIDLEPVIHSGDWLLVQLRKLPGILNTTYPLPRIPAIEIHGLIFQSPLIAAAFKDDRDSLEFWLQLGLGAVCMKTIMPEPRSGNARPRIQELIVNGHAGLINALGLPGPGINQFIKALSHSPLWAYNRPIGISVGGNGIEDYVQVIAALTDWFNLHSYPYYLELNISCPNTSHGRSLSDDPEQLMVLLAKAREMTDAPISVKLSPDQSDESIIDMVTRITAFEKMIINVGNTQFKVSDQLSRGGGGVSGPYLYNRTRQMVRLIASQNVPIIATGGIATSDQVIQLLNDGASLVGMATGIVTDPFRIVRLNAALEQAFNQSSK